MPERELMPAIDPSLVDGGIFPDTTYLLGVYVEKLQCAFGGDVLSRAKCANKAGERAGIHWQRLLCIGGG